MTLDLFKQRTIVDIALENADQLSKEFLHWLPANLHVWDAFVRETQKVIDRGYQHYSSRTILEFLRHHSMVHESGPVYKLNNNMQPYLARLFDVAYPKHAGLFSYRETTKDKGKAA